MSPPSAIDPTLLTVLSIFGGAALTAAAGVVGAMLQSRREHQRWLRDQRLRAYADVATYLRDGLDAKQRDVALHGRPNVSPESWAELGDDWRRQTERFSDVTVRLALFGPPDVEAKALRVMSHLRGQPDDAAFVALEGIFLEAAKATLRIGPRRWRVAWHARARATPRLLSRSLRRVGRK